MKLWFNEFSSMRKFVVYSIVQFDIINNKWLGSIQLHNELHLRFNWLVYRVRFMIVAILARISPLSRWMTGESQVRITIFAYCSVRTNWAELTGK
jgi:hypothetical protein